MENAVDALKMAAASLIFVVAFSLAMMMFSKSRIATDAIISNLRLKDFFPSVEALENNTTREVGIETVIPTLYRYCQSDDNFRIVILAPKGAGTTEHQVFDTALESVINQGIKPSEIDDSTTEGKRKKIYYESIYSKYNDATKLAYMFEAPWLGQDSEYYRTERVNAYIYGTKAKNMPKVDYTGSNVSGNSGLMGLISGKAGIFKESYIEYTVSGKVTKDEYGEEIVEEHPRSKIIVTYELMR